MNELFVFDVDGTLTPSRQPMTADFADWFREFFKDRRYAFVSGSDYIKLQEQLPADILDKAQAVFACSGNSIWTQGSLIHKNNWIPPAELLADLAQDLKDCSYDVQTGNHIEIRTGLVNFSFVGRNCTAEQRKAFHAWDQEHNLRLWECLKLRQKYPDLTFEIGGEISFDIYPRDCDKSQILKYLSKSTIYFFGDGISPGRNDYSLAQALKFPSRSFPVIDWKDTKHQLEQLVKLS